MSQTRTVKLELDAEDALKRLDSLEKELRKVSETTRQTGKGTRSLADGFTAVGLAWKAIGIGAVITALQFLADKFSSNQAILDKFNIASAVFGDIMTQIGTIISSVVNALGLLGKAVGKVLRGEFREAGEIAKQSFDGVKESIVGNNESFSDFIKNAKDGAKASVEFAKSMNSMRNEVKLAEAQQRQLQLTFQKEAEIQRQIRDDISLTFQERIAANEELGRVLDQQFAEEQALANKKVALAELELSRNKTNIDLQVALINAKTELADLDERITGQRSEQLTNLKALEKEKADADKAIADEQIAADKKRTESEKIEADKRKQIAEAERAMKIGLAKSIIGSLGQLAGEGTKAAKAAALAQIMIDTASGISSAIKGATAAAAAAGPAAPVVTPLLITQLVGQVLAGVAAAKGILKKVPGPSDSGTDNVNIPAGSNGGFTGFGGLAPNLEAISPPDLDTVQPVQAFVVENDISDAQALQEELEIQATL
tara:strand:+ start:377 stop:1834 length:1458 start_codon:yes stop_codon:yes gene_type:complete